MSRTRDYSHTCRKRYVRLLSTGRRFQARLWIPAPYGSINLGLYPTEEAAWRATQAVIARLATDKPATAATVWEATKQAIAAGAVRKDVLPKYVRRVKGRYFGRAKRAVVGPFDSPEAAHDAAVRAMRRPAWRGPVVGVQMAIPFDTGWSWE